MANFDTCNLLTAQTILSDRYAAPEMRMKPAPAFSLLTANTDLLMQSAEVLRTREDRAIEAYFLGRTKRNPTSARAYNHTGTLDDSAKVTLSWTIKADKTTISLKLLDNSVHDFNMVLANKLEQCCMNILEAKETEAIAYLQAQKASQQPTGLQGATLNAGVLEIAGVDDKQIFARIRSIMRQNYFSGGLDMIVDSNLSVKAEFLNAQGNGNATNYGYQFNNLRIAESIELTEGAYNNGVAIVMPQGGACALNWIPKQNRQGSGDYNSYVGGFGVFNFMGYQFALHGYAQRSDTSATNGNTQDVTMEFEVSLDSSYNKAPLSYTTGRTDSVIHEFAQVG